jgi:hypothetical protein
MTKKSRSSKEIGEEIKIPIETIDKIDKLIKSSTTLFTSREDFIKSAVEMKIRELKNFGPR